MANGRVITGFSKPYVALYTATASGGSYTISYSSGQILARGVEIQIEPETTDDNNFYADNVIAENEAGLFTGGTLTLTVDGLKDAANKLIYGLPSATSEGWFDYDNTQAIPFVGFGAVIRVQEAGVVSYVPIVLPKIQFNDTGMTAATQEDSIDWQSAELTAQIFRDESVKQTWKKLGEAQSSEAAAEAKIKTFLEIS